MKWDLREGMFNEEVTDGIEVIRSIVDMNGLAERVKAVVLVLLYPNEESVKQI